MGVPIRATMDTTQVGETPQGIPVFLDNYALEADHTVVVGERLGYLLTGDPAYLASEVR